MSPTARRQAVVLTAAPRGFVVGRAGTTVRVGVHVSPRLSYAGDGGTLASFPDWVSWPSTAVTWRVVLGGQTLTPTVVSAAPDPALWQAAFRPSLRVDSFTGDPGPARTVRGYSYAALEGHLRTAYSGNGFGRSPFALAAAEALARGTGQAGTTNTTEVRAAIDQYLGFWSPRGERATGERGELDTDFHDRLSLVGDHAPLLERLGLVVVLEVPLVTATRETTVQVLGAWTPGAGVETQVVTPRTQAVYDPAQQVFVARRRSPSATEHTERLHLATNVRVFSTHSLHVDAATAGSIGVAASGTDDTDTGAAPTSGGITLALAGRMRRVQDDLSAAEATARATVTSPTAPPDRFAEDIVVGHHVEIGVGAPPVWFGLGHREVTYTVVRDGQAPLGFTAVDEAAVTAVGRQADPEDPSALLVSDVVMRWDGWSLGVPRPGVHLLQDDPVNGSVDDTQGRPADTWLTLDTRLPETSADGGDARLPLLRYGQLYAVRGRAVDVTGGSPGWDGAVATPSRPYLRFDPAPTPLVLPPSDALLVRGESARTLVVRSDPRSGQLPTVASSRTLVPPRASIETGLLHGWFDDDGVPSSSAYAVIRDLDAAEVPARGPDPTGPTREPRSMLVDWLPDPMATTVRVGLLDADGAEVDHRDAGFVPTEAGDARTALGSWQSVALRLEGVTVGAFPTLVQSGQGTSTSVVTVGLPPARVARLALRALPDEETLAVHGLVDWDPSPTFAETVAKVADGELPQLTPTTYVDVVHAVRRPLADPVLGDVVLTRVAGAKDAALLADLEVHADSTSRVTLYASWTERVDDGPRLLGTGAVIRPSTRSVPRTRIVETSIDVDPTSPERSLSVEGVVPFGDLRRRDVVVRAVATSRFVPEFREPLPFTSSSALLPAGVDPESVEVLRAATRSPLTLDRDYRLVADGSRWRLTLVGIAASAVVVEGVRGTVVATSAPSVLTVVPAAVRPEPPKVLYAVPAFSVAEPERDDSGAWRAGRGASRLRIYLERPWWSSGEGEGLAVVTRTGIDLSSDPDGTSPGARLSTLYGADAALSPGLSPVYEQDLTSGERVEGLRLDDEGAPGGSTCEVRVHEVLYDTTRDLYYTEVQLLPQPAGTFVRLAVARYQPEVSETVSNLSRIVAMDPVQLLAPREVTVVRRTSSGGDAVQVLVTGATHRGPLETTAPVVKVSLQVKVVRGSGADLGWDTVSVATKRARSDGEGFDRVTVVVPADARGTMRVLVEELETWLSEDSRGRPVDPWPVGKSPASLPQAEAHLRARRVTWVATTPMPSA